jgi:3-phenylpropionate/trans-cinnamate dioxygenase ferredoxin reductase subunit
MADFRYLIVGGGMTADAAVEGIRLADSTGNIAVVSDEQHPPYKRPPLSKSLWKGDPLESIWLETPRKGIDLLLSRTITDIDPGRKRAIDNEGRSYTFTKLLLATGGRVRRLPGDPPGVIYYRTLDDYRKLRALTERGNSFAVVGGGFIGAEIAAALSMNGKSVTMIFPEEAIGSRVYPRSLAMFLNTYYAKQGVGLITGEGVSEISRRGERHLVRTSSGRSFEADGVVAGIGIEPNTELARSARLAVENGIRVDEYLRTSSPDLYAAGDVACFSSTPLGRFVRVEHEDNARMMGVTAGRNMAGESVPYRHLPFFYSDLFDLGYEAVGDIDARLDTVEDWKEQYREGVVYYLRDGRVMGVLLWNTWGKVDAARALIEERATHTRHDLAGLIRA